MRSNNDITGTFIVTDENEYIPLRNIKNEDFRIKQFISLSTHFYGGKNGQKDYFVTVNRLKDKTAFEGDKDRAAEVLKKKSTDQQTICFLLNKLTEVTINMASNVSFDNIEPESKTKINFIKQIESF